MLKTLKNALNYIVKNRKISCLTDELRNKISIDDILKD